MHPFVAPPAGRGNLTGLYTADLGKQTVVSAAAATDGASITCTFPIVQPPDYAWRVDRVVVQCTGVKTPLCLLYDNPQMRTLDLADGTTDGGLNVADNASALLLLQGDQLIVVFEGCSAGAVATTRIQYVVLRRS